MKTKVTLKALLITGLAAIFTAGYLAAQTEIAPDDAGAALLEESDPSQRRLPQNEREPDLSNESPAANSSWNSLAAAAETRNSGRLKGSEASLVGLADTAENFYKEYPTHPKANEARKIEIVSLLEIDTNSEKNDRLSERVKNYRQNRGIPSSARAQIASTYDLRQSTKNRKSLFQIIDDQEVVAKNLRVEFPDDPTGDNILLHLASNRSNRRALEMGREVARNATSQKLKDRANALVSRIELVGSSIPQVFNSKGGMEGFEEGRLCVVYSWSIHDPGSLSRANLLGQRNISKANWIGVNIDEPTKEFAPSDFAQKHNFPGRQIDRSGRYSSIVKRLGMDKGGLVYMADEEGKIFNVHVHDDWARILSSFGL